MSAANNLQSARDLAKDLAAGRLGSRDLLEQQLSRIKDRNPSVNAVVAVALEKARIRADEADAAIRRGECWGPLHGLPMTIKDTFDVDGMPPRRKQHAPTQVMHGRPVGIGFDGAQFEAHEAISRSGAP